MREWAPPSACSGSTMDISLTVNGQRIDRTIADDRPLCDVLREDLRLTGTKIGCREGVCGSCTVMLDGRPIRSCLMLAAQADGRRITTIEGIAEPGQLHAVQQAFVDRDALQCGFCTPGVVMSAVALLESDPSPTAEAVRDGLAGNICRCTGYGSMVEAVLEAADRRAPGNGDGRT